MFEKNKEKMKEKMEPDKVLRFAIVAVILLFLIGALIIGTRMMNPRVDATEGVKKLTELEDANVQKIDAKIQELEQTEADEAAAWKAKSAKEKMDGCIVLGDSTALVLMWSIMAASVVDLPLPVGPVTRIRPRGSSASFVRTGGMASSSKVGMESFSRRSVAAALPCW